MEPRQADPGGAPRTWARIVRATALGAMTMGGLVLSGWALEIPRLAGALPGPIPMAPNTALCFLALGTGFWFLSAPPPRPRFATMLCAALAIAVGLWTLAEYAAGADLGAHRLLFPAAVTGIGSIPPVRMAFATALDFVLLGSALLMLDVGEDRSHWPSQALALLVLVTAGYVIEGYCLGISGIHRPPPPLAMAFPTALAFWFLGSAVFWARPRAGLMQLLTEPSEDLRVLRGLLPALILVPILTGWGHVVTERLGLLDRETGEAVQSTLNVAFILGAFAWTGRRLLQLRRQRAVLEEERQRLTHLYATLSQVNQTILRHPEQGELLAEALRICVRTGGFDAASILDRDDAGAWAPLAAAGLALVPGLVLAAAERSPVVIRDWEQEPTGPLRERLMAVGLRSSAAFPIPRRGSHPCLLQLHARPAGFIGPDRAALLAELAGDLGMDFDARAAEQARAQAEEALRRAKEDLERMVQERTAQLQATNEDLEAFVYSVSHDLRSPIQAVTGFARILEQEPQLILAEDGQGLPGRIRQAAARMDQIIEDLLRLSRVGRSELVLISMDLADLAERILAGLLEAAPGRQVAFRSARPLPVRGDPRLLRLVLENLLGNALKFTAQREEAVLELGGGARDDGFTEVFLRDNGAGFPTAQAHRLFSPFQRLHSLRDFPGTGIGLALVKRIVVRHGGQVRAEGEEGQGACFTFSLPTGDRP